MNRHEDPRASSRTRGQRRLTWMTIGVAAVGLVSTGAFGVAAAATYAGEATTAQITADGTRPDEGFTTDAGSIPDPAATPAPASGVQLFAAPAKKKHATSGGSH